MSIDTAAASTQIQIIFPYHMQTQKFGLLRVLMGFRVNPHPAYIQHEYLRCYTLLIGRVWAFLGLRRVDLHHKKPCVSVSINIQPFIQTFTQ